MKIPWLAATSLLLIPAATIAQTPPSGTRYNLVLQDANSRVWESTTHAVSSSGWALPWTNRIVELATGLNFKDTQTGQWLSSKEEINILPDGTAAATQGSHQVYFPADIYEGVICVVTPDGLQQKSRPLGLFLGDGTNVAMIAVLTNSVGELVSSNQVVYPNAFLGLDADIRYTYHIGGIEQDIVLHSRPKAPASLGLNPGAAHLDMVTEFFGTEEPIQRVLPVDRRDGMSDTLLTFGRMQMVPGQAMLVGTNGQTEFHRGVPTYKSWVHDNGRELLIEAVPLRRIQTDLNQLQALAGSTTNTFASDSVLEKVSTHLLLPPPHSFAGSGKSAQIARVSRSREGGVMLDYRELVADTNDFVFLANTTYFIGGNVTLTGTTRFEPGTVLKFSETNGYSITISGDLVCDSTPDNMAVFTSENDNSTGDTLPWSSGIPAANCQFFTIYGGTFSNCRFQYAGSGISGYCDFNNVECFQCGTVITQESDGTNYLTANNGLVSSCGLFCDGDAIFANVTFDNGYAAANLDCAFTNCIFSSMNATVTNSAPGIVPNATGSNNGFDNSGQQFGDNPVSFSGNYQAGPLGNYYLSPGSSAVNAGSETADQVGLYHYTTQTNQVLETNSVVDLGYHYIAFNGSGNPPDSNGDGIPDYLEDANGDGLWDNGETNWALAILTQPASLLANVGTNPAFSVTAGGIATIQYQWYSNSVALAGATNAALTFNNVQTNSAGNYFVIVTNNYGALTSFVATLGVVVTPTVTITNPLNNAVFAGSPTNITIQASASDTAGDISVQFFQGTTSLGILTSAPYALVWSNATSGNYALTAVATDNGLTSTSPVVNITISPAFATNAICLWLKADAIAGLTNNAPVTNWPDGSGWNNNASQTGSGSRPFYTTNVLAGLPIVRFSGAQSLNLPVLLSSLMGQTNQGEAVVVLKSSIASGGGCGLWSLSGNGFDSAYPYSNGGIYEAFGSSADYSLGIPVQPLAQFNVYEISALNTNWTAWMNSLPLFHVANNAYRFTSGGVTLGSSLNGGFVGDIAEVMFFSRALTVGERTIINAYLNGKYALVPAVPAAPSNLVAKAISPTQIALSWNEASNQAATQISIERSTNGSSGFAAVAQVAGTMSYLDTNLTPGTTYYYQVRAINLTMWSPYSNVTNATTLSAGSSLPLSNIVLWLKADTGLQQTGTNSAIAYWPDQSGNGNDALQTAAANRPALTTGALNGLPTVQFVDGNYLNWPAFLTGTTQAEVFAVLAAATNRPATQQALWRLGANNTGNIAYPNTSGHIVEGFGSTAYYDIGVPVPPINQYDLYEVAGWNGGWSAWFNGVVQFSTTNNTYGYWTYNPSLGNGGSFAGNIAEVLVFNRTLAAGERTAVYNYLDGKYNLTATPATPTNLIATAISTNQISLTWDETWSQISLLFTVQRSTTSNGTYQTVAQLWNANSYVDTNLPAGTTFYYKVQATSLSKISPSSGMAQATTLTNGTSLPLGSLALWLKADSGLPQPGTNTAVGSWADQSGNGNNASQAVSVNDPTWVPDVLGDRPVMRFSGTNSQYFALPSFMSGFTGAEAFVVLKAASANPASASGLWQFGTSAAGLNIGYPEPDGSLADNFCGNNEYFKMGVPALPLTQYNVYTVTSQNGNWAAWIDGALQYQTTNNAFYTITPTLGASINWWANVYFFGDIAEVLVFNRPLTENERWSVNAYLNGKYGLVQSVPAAPTNLVATAISTNQISLTWDEPLNGGATEIGIERSTASNGTYQVVAQIIGATAYVDTNGLAGGMTYYYRVRAISLTQWSDYSGVAEATTPNAGVSVPFGALSLWLKADAGLARASSNETVNFWPDQSGNGNSATSPGPTNQPIWVPNAIGDRSVIRFNGSNQYFNLPAFMSTATAGEAFIVLKASVPNSFQELWEMGGYSYNCGSSGSSAYPDSDGSIRDDFGSTSMQSLGTPIQPLTQLHMFEVSSQTNNWEAWMNGVLLSQTTNNTVSFGNSPTLGAGYYSSACQIQWSYFKGDIAEILVFNRALTNDEHAAVENYLNQKYALVNNTNTPTAPAYLTAVAASLSQINLSWVNTSLALAEVQIERKTDIGGSYALIATVAAGVTNYSDTGLAAGHVYYYRIRATNLASNSPYSNEAGALLDVPPTVSLTSPTNGALYISAANIPLAATASSSDTTIASVQFFSNGTNSLGVVTNAPYNLTWSNVLHGVYSLTATVTDSLGVTSNSAAVSITVSNPPPSVTITNPANNTIFIAPATVALAANASDPNGSVAKVDYYFNTTHFIGESASSPYNFNWTNVLGGNYTLTAIATDNEGATATSSVVNIVISNIPPTISITSPINNALFQAPATIPLTVNANDTSGYLVKVDYYYGVTNLIGESTNSPFSLVWSNVAAGTNSITAKATDNLGASATSSAITVIVNAQPTVNITNPVNNAMFNAGANVTINVSATDADGTIGSVAFYYANTNYLIGSKTSAPYSMVLTNAPSGTYTLVAKALDNRGGIGFSSPITISVGTNLSDVADSYVQRSHLTNNFGTVTPLLVQTNGSTENEDAYFKFNTSGTVNVIGAKFYFNATSSKANGAVGVLVYATGTNWTETGIAWTNRPALGTIIGSTNISGTSSTWYSVDVTSYVQAQRAGGTNVISLAIHATNSSTLFASVNSKEASTNSPYLQIFATNTPPTVSITSPTNYSVFLPSTNVSIAASASSSNGRIYQVQFIADSSTSLGIVTNTPYAVTWTNVPSGAHALTAIATDNLGYQTVSVPIFVLNDTSPNTTDSSGDGIPDGWEALWGLNPLLNNWAQSNQRANYSYTPADWFNQVSGTKIGTVNLDNEGNVLQVSQ